MAEQRKDSRWPSGKPTGGRPSLNVIRYERCKVGRGFSQDRAGTVSNQAGIERRLRCGSPTTISFPRRGSAETRLLVREPEPSLTRLVGLGNGPEDGAFWIEERRKFEVTRLRVCGIRWEWFETRRFESY